MARRLVRAQLQKRLLETEEVRALITERAHQLYMQRGAEPGNEMDDWLCAENICNSLHLLSVPSERIRLGWASNIEPRPHFSSPNQRQQDRGEIGAGKRSVHVIFLLVSKICGLMPGPGILMYYQLMV